MVQVRAATPADIAGLARLLAEMQRHYGQPVPEERAQAVAEFLCTVPREGFNPLTLLAHADGAVIGSCILNVMLPAAELNRSLYIRDLFVSGGTRQRGIGRALVRGACMLVRDGGFCALDWTTDTLNAPAKRMYEACGAAVQHRTYFRLSGETLREVIGD